MKLIESRTNAILQQGINLANIIKDLTISEETGLPILTESINQLKSFISGEKELSHDALLQHIKIITNECNKVSDLKLLDNLI